MAEDRFQATGNTSSGEKDRVTMRPSTRPTPRGGSEVGKAMAEKPAAHEPKDNFREIIETVVFVVVLVLLLKTFVAEAFVIPTGSMATTLLGYHGDVTCKECGLRFTVNRSEELPERNRVNPQGLRGCVCPNCRAYNTLDSR